MKDGVPGALVRYRVMAYVVGVLLVVLVLVGVPMKYLAHDDRVVTWTGVPHGWLYMILLITAFDLGRRVGWSWRRLLLIALAGTVPFLSFVAERSATKNVRDALAEQTAAESTHSEESQSTGDSGDEAETSADSAETSAEGTNPQG